MADEPQEDPGRMSPADSPGPSHLLRPFKPLSIEEVAGELPKYEVLEEVGRGNMGAVYKARQPELDRIVAIKLLPRVEIGEDLFAPRFQREAKAMARLHHPNILMVHEFRQTESGQYFIVMEYVDGVTLQELLRERALDRSEVFDLMTQICDAMKYAHEKGVVHRDIKPANILVSRNRELKVADFGLAKLIGGNLDTALTRTNVGMGTPDYVAPEQLEESATVDQRADIYSMGVMLYEMLTQAMPRGMFEMPSKKMADIDPRFDEVISKAMQPDPDFRYQEVAEMNRDLRNILATPWSGAEAGAREGPTGEGQEDSATGGLADVLEVRRGSGSLASRFRRGAPAVLLAALLVGVISAGIIWLDRGGSAGGGPELWAEPVNIGPGVNSEGNESAPAVSGGGNALFFSSDSEDGFGDWDLWVAMRERDTEAFGAPVNLLEPANSLHNDMNPSLSADGLALYFSSDAPMGSGKSDLYVVRRATSSGDFTAADNLGPVVNSDGTDGAPSISGDGLTLYFHADREGGFGRRDIWLARRSSVDEPFGEPENAGPEVNGTGLDHDPEISADGLRLYFSSNRLDGNQDIYVARRNSTDEPFGAAERLAAPVNTEATESAPALSPDGKTLYFVSDREGGFGGRDLWATTLLDD